MRFSRRNFIRLTGAGLLAANGPSLLAGTYAGNGEITGPGLPFDLGIASYTFRKFSLEDTIAMTRRLKINKLCLKSMHLPLELTPDQIKAEAAKVRDAGIDPYGAGVIYMTTIEEVDRAFAYAGHAGMKVIIGSPEHGLLEYCNGKVKKTGIRMAIHNHGPGDEQYPTPESAYRLISDMEPGMGLCIDIGHTLRIGADPIAETAKYMDRVLDIHIKDEDKADETGNTCEIGHGVIDIPGFLEMLLKEKYGNVVSFEYEKDEDDPMAGLAESVGYVRGVLRMIA
jgi:inosose dehydratase